MAVVRAFAIFSLSFVLFETVTGAISLATGYLSIPPFVGIVTGVDLAVLMAGLAVTILRASKKILMPE